MEKSGDTGTNGQDGYTQQKGVDYWTQQDKNEIVSDVETDIQPILEGKVDKSSFVYDSLTQTLTITITTEV